MAPTSSSVELPARGSRSGAGYEPGADRTGHAEPAAAGGKSLNRESTAALGGSPRLPTEPGRPPCGSLRVYVGRIRLFNRQDWWVYAGWVGLMLGLVGATSGFLLFGHSRGVRFPAEAWLVPAGASLFALSIALDTIGHRTVYKAEIQGAEGLVHGITILCGVLSCVALCAAYGQPGWFWVPAMVFTVLSLIYSLVDEAFHWRRYVRHQADPVEMWSHVGILCGHGIMMLGWWAWFFQGYPGVQDTLAQLTAL